VEPDVLALFDKYYGSLENYLKRRLIDSSLAEDLVQETFLQAFDCRDAYDPERGSERTWLFGIATNLLRHHFRDEERGLRAYARAAYHETDSLDEDTVCFRLDAEAQARAIADAIASLSAPLRDVVALHYQAGLPQREVAAALQIPLGTVKTRLLTARANLRSQLEFRIARANDG